MLRTPMLRNEKEYNELYSYKIISNFFKHIFEQELSNASRRSDYVWGMRAEREQEIISKFESSPLLSNSFQKILQIGKQQLAFIVLCSKIL